ncbi:MAG: N-acetyltransferase [Methanomicrobia archaeon]|nr:N-acetyltransferase [Methanomicrobia archaeon]
MKYIDKTAEIEENVKIGENTKIWHHVHIREKTKIGKNCNIGKGVYIDREVKIGDNCKIQNYACLYKGVELGNDVFIGPHVVFTNDLYPRSFIWDDTKITRTVVNRGASIGANSTIICGIVVGKYAMIGAGSVVTKDVPDHGLVYGNPSLLKGYACTCGTKLIKKNNRYSCPKCKKEVIL